MWLRRLWLYDFRNYHAAEVTLGEGLTVVVGSNGEGKTNLLEAVGYLATLSSFRGAPAEALVRAGCARAVVRGEGSREGRPVLVEAELTPTGRGRASLNRQPVRRAEELVGTVRATVFSPDDLELVKGGPAARRRYLDDTLVALHPRHGVLRRDVERVLRQRNALLGQAGGRLTPAVADSLDVWDAKLAELGEALASARQELVKSLEPLVVRAYDAMADDQAAGGTVCARYEQTWREEGLAEALARTRAADVRRATTGLGPHRDELALSIGPLPARTHCSQGEQRSLALALRLGAHQLVADTVGQPPVLLLDDVFSELDGRRSRALVAHLPPGQAVLTTTGAVPDGTRAERVLHVAAGTIVEAGGR